LFGATSTSVVLERVLAKRAKRSKLQTKLNPIDPHTRRSGSQRVSSFCISFVVPGFCENTSLPVRVASSRVDFSIWGPVWRQKSGNYHRIIAFSHYNQLVNYDGKRAGFGKCRGETGNRMCFLLREIYGLRWWWMSGVAIPAANVARFIGAA
jgi:hypothetical protein